MCTRALMTRTPWQIHLAEMDRRIGAGAPTGQWNMPARLITKSNTFARVNKMKLSICQNPAKSIDLSESTEWHCGLQFWTIESPIFMAILFLNKGEQLQVNKQGEQSKTFKREKQHKKHYVKINWSKLVILV